jgi:hypothetical protein
MTQAFNDSWDDPAKTNMTISNDPVAKVLADLRAKVETLLNDMHADWSNPRYRAVLDLIDGSKDARSGADDLHSVAGDSGVRALQALTDLRVKVETLPSYVSEPDEREYVVLTDVLALFDGSSE